ncbi:MAG: LysM peptidoglycan-binding domain-containing protein [Deltaproteobacteria bacterium]|jgi:cell shape-determining protein MreC|nr:LysM peptidoglycan-binding domain-containing protein [Deltaproteobacteria bacterium]
MFKTSSADWLFNWSARGILLVFMVLTLFFVSGCGGVSEEELNKLKAENQALEEELEQEKSKSELLNRALTNSYRERDRLADLINVQSQVEEPIDPNLGDLLAPIVEVPIPSSQTYTVQTGDTLSTIAQRHNTSTATLLALNPYLMDRNNYMVWENDKIRLPD